MPSPEAVEKALALIEKRAVNHAYFFSELKTPDWIEPLSAAGFFADPPPPRIDGDLISFPHWPESEYLARMASHAPEQVGGIILRIPVTENTSVRQDLARAANHLPVEMAVEWAVREAEWISQQQHVHWPIAEALGPVIERLAECGATDAAIMLAKSLLELRVVVDSSGRRPTGADCPETWPRPSEITQWIRFPERSRRRNFGGCRRAGQSVAPRCAAC